jgi:hypothetical protein
MDTKTNRKPTKNYRTNRKSTQKTTVCWASSVTMISDLRRRLFFSASMSTHHGKNVTATHHRRAARVVISERRARASSESGAPIQKPSHFRVGRAGTILYYGLFRFSKPAQPSISGASRQQPRRLCARTNGARWRIGKYCIAGQNRHPLTQSFSAISRRRQRWATPPVGAGALPAEGGGRGSSVWGRGMGGAAEGGWGGR